MKHVVFKRGLLFTIFCAGLFSFAKAQTALDTAMARYGSDYLQERVYIQFDKGLYSPGETIWFKAYLMAGIENSEISKSFYIDWTDADGNLIQHTSSPIIESSARGQLDIPAGYTGKIINARAYTKWMLNFDTAFLFNKAIRIAPKKASAGTAQPVKFKSLIQFFPEGGDLIEGISSKVAFKATNEIGEPVKAKGTIVSSKGETVGKFASVHDGMGVFTLEPAAGVTYKAKWTDDANNAYETPLPAAKTFGATVAIIPSQGKANFLIKRSENVPAALKQLHIIATTYQQLVYKANVRLEETSAIGGSIPTAQLPSGILQVTLFDDSYTPVAERICFVNNNDAIFKPNVDFYSLNLGKRGKNTLEIDLPDTVAANLSVAVTDAGIAADSSNNLVSHLLLGSELKGYIHNPWYYFSSDNDTVRNNLDYVMLTNGWRRFKWGELAKGILPQIKYPADTAYAELGGKVFGATPMQMRESGDLFAIVQGKDSSTQMLTFPIAKDGSFKQPGFVFFDSLKIHYQFGKARGLESAVEVRFTSGLLTTPGKVSLNKSLFAYMLNDTTGNARAKYFADEQARLEKLLQGTTLEGVTVKSRTKSPQQVLDEKYTSGLFSGGNSTSFDVANDIAAQGQMNIFTYLQGRVAGLQITGAPSNTSLMWRGGAPDVYLDEMKVDVQQLQNIPMPDVAYVKAFTPPFFGSFGGGSNGAIAVYTRKGGDVKQAPGKGLPTKIVWGYSTMKEFYSPNYETFDERNEHSDVRSTLYWNPYVLTTQENHKIRLTFYNNDITEKYRVIVEGVTKDGKLTHIEQVYE
ncbi:hypothetical protein QTN47_13950 [Danxiaibacter flavus]|uniref:TonB-dependent receptor plug domain-containing protein n=1 Tax=Danxiaibacter flavus TaxID=3049108 RepID=A0ABV3ZFH8_9BACT|nr:hypothetical protein QNM32_13955 [Chitinophagaceae bacterium DXS]